MSLVSKLFNGVSLACLLGPCFLSGCAPKLHAEVLIVVNGESPVSEAIGEYYRLQRNVPASNVLALSIPLVDPTLSSSAHETIERSTYETEIRNPIERFLEENRLTEEVSIIVLAKGVPLRISGPNGEVLLRDSMRASVDAELAILLSGLDGRPGIEGMTNPYFNSDLSFARFRAEQPETPLRYLVARLTGYQQPIDPDSGVPVDVKALIDAAAAFGPQGRFLIDEDPKQPPARLAGNLAMVAPAAAMLTAFGFPGTHDKTSTFVSDFEQITSYVSWGSNDTRNPGAPYYGSIDGQLYPGTFAPRSIAIDIVSTNARTFTYPATYGQSLIADLIRLGVAGSAGSVFEPTLAGVTRPHVFVRHYAQGVPAGEAFYRSVPYLGWMTVYVGDPLMRSLRVAPLPEDLDGDGISNELDNCAEIPNPAQRDANQDGFGNLCDADVDNDGIVATSWAFTDPHRTAPCPTSPDIESICLALERGRFVPSHDLDTDGDVDELDLSLAVAGLFFPPGP
jgi:uncharacterized protein (TIGR03790 family)